MRIEIHMLQNHSPANLNRDDLGAPKTCWFGGVLRARISSQCLKRSIRRSPYFQELACGIRTRRLAELISEEHSDQVRAILEQCGFKPRKSARSGGEDNGAADGEQESRMLIFTTRQAVDEMKKRFETALPRLKTKEAEQKLAQEFAEIIAKSTASPDMALFGRMLEPSTDGPAKNVWAALDTRVEAALQTAHAFSTHQANLEVDYYVAADDVPGRDAGAGYVDEAQFVSACFYKYFSICWETLKENLKGVGATADGLAAHTVGAFLRAAALTTPTGKQNSFAAHNPPDGILVELRELPITYANAFVRPAEAGQRDLVSEAVAQLAHYVHDMDAGFGPPQHRLWFSPNLRHRLEVNGQSLAKEDLGNLDRLVEATVGLLGFEWSEVQQHVVR